MSSEDGTHVGHVVERVGHVVVVNCVPRQYTFNPIYKEPISNLARLSTWRALSMNGDITSSAPINI